MEEIMERKIKVLFVCIHNSARSQIAEALLKKIGGDRFEVQSSGLEPGTLNPLAVEVMREMGIDISTNLTKSVFDFFTSGSLFDYVITVCDGASSEKCPIFPGITKRIRWSFEDPAALEGDHEAKLAATRKIRDEIHVALEAFIKQTAAQS
jgi:arsenate reductase